MFRNITGLLEMAIMKFNSDLGVFVCPHVFKATRPILLVVHEDGDWQCLCGGNDHSDDGHLVGIGHLVERDPSLDELVDLPDGWEAERHSPEQPWECKNAHHEELGRYSVQSQPISPIFSYSELLGCADDRRRIVRELISGSHF
ncbi:MULTISPECIES: hypothetical protein [Methylobacter]|jgi:hypothetical protein|uniref:hypothetical protein n=1 Tax=Methylobacter TaxID=429 RepID=UPI001267FBFF|nr:MULTISPECIES: hypothetical protein [Methylobacter]